MLSMNCAPIVLFTYCRPWHTRQTVEALLKNTEAVQSDLIIYSDAPKNEKVCQGVEETRAYIRSVKGFKSIQIVERQENWGLAKNLIDGITKVVNGYGRVIVIEDDIVVSPYFLKYMNDGLDLYNDNNEVASIHGYVYPTGKKLPETFFIKGADCWGWATWARAWKCFNSDANYLLDNIVAKGLQKEFDFDNSYPYVEMLKAQVRGDVNSWAICWYASTFLNNMYTLYPGKSMVRQIGMDGVGGTHSAQTSIYDVDLCMYPVKVELLFPIMESSMGKEAFVSFFKGYITGRTIRVKRLFLQLLRKLR